MISAARAALGALALAACVAGRAGDIVTLDNVAVNYEPLSVSVFAGGGGYATIEGTTRDGASREEIAAALRLPPFLAQRTVRAAPEGERQDGPHLVLIFAPQGAATPHRACRGEVEGGAAGETLTVFGVFCSSFGEPVSEALFTAAGSPVPSDPDFGDRLSVLMNEVMPITNPDSQGCSYGRC